MNASNPPHTANIQKGPGVSLFILHPSFKLSPVDIVEALKASFDSVSAVFCTAS